MKRGTKILVGLLWVFIIVAGGHAVFHFYLFGTGIQGFFENGVSGFSIGGFTVGEEKTGAYSAAVSISQTAVIVEWLAILFIFALVYTRNRIEFSKEMKSLQSEKAGVDARAKTDLDKLYELLKNKKRISFSAVRKVFDVDEELVKSWAETLKSGNLAGVDYPRIGGPELVLLEQSQGEKKK